MSKSQLRIIGGRWRGRKIPFIAEPGLRPTPDRVRETVFNWLTTHLPDAGCLDVFAGSGALGFEALSRGARSVTMLDANRKVVAQLQQNIQALQCQAQVHLQQTDALQFLRQPVDTAFDLIFLDPPFKQGLIEQSLQLIVRNGWLAPEGWIYYEAEAELPEESLKALGLHAIKQKRAGEVHFGLVRHAS